MQQFMMRCAYLRTFRPKHHTKLKSDLSEQIATDLLWTLLTVENWEKLVLDCAWSQLTYEDKMIELAEAVLLKN